MGILNFVQKSKAPTITTQTHPLSKTFPVPAPPHVALLDVIVLPLASRPPSGLLSLHEDGERRGPSSRGLLDAHLAPSSEFLPECPPSPGSFPLFFWIPGDLTLFPLLKVQGYVQGRGSRQGLNSTRTAAIRSSHASPGLREGQRQMREGQRTWLPPGLVREGLCVLRGRHTSRSLCLGCGSGGSSSWGLRGASVCLSLLRWAGLTGSSLQAGPQPASCCVRCSLPMGVFDSGLIDNCLVGSGVSGLGVRGG